jgi:type IV secretion system protein VirB6
MSDVCTAVPQGAGFVSSMTSYIDCQAQTLGSGAWTALAAPGSTLAVVLTGFLTIFIALIGYNLLLARSLTVRDGSLAFVKIGAVFALATSWPAYRTLVYDLVTDGPFQLVAEIGPQAGVVGSDATLLQRLDLADQALAQLAILGPGNPPPGTYTQLPPPPFGGFDAFALGGSRILFLLTAIAGLAVVRIVTGLMLALGPFFIAFLLFESTRSLFEGWVRVLAGAALAAIGVSIALGLELALIEPWLSNILARRMAGEALPTVASELFVIVTLFTIIVVAALYSCARIARAFRLPQALRAVPFPAQFLRTAGSALPSLERASPSASEAERTRAAAVANVLMSMNRREGSAPVSETRALFDAGRPSAAHRDAVRPTTALPVGRTFTRRATSRVSARANRRDATA